MCLSVNEITNTNYESISELRVGARLKQSEETILKRAIKVVCKPVQYDQIYVSDFLALATQYTRKTFQLISLCHKGVKKSIPYKILLKTTQPAHVMLALTVLFVSYCLWPASSEIAGGDVDAKISPLTTIIYLGSFATHFGAMIWMTFISGLALYFSLPRHTFGKCQEILFPKYFQLSSVLSALTLITFVKMNRNMYDMRTIVQLIMLSVCLLMEMIIVLYFTKPLLKLMQQKYMFEERAGNGKEIGHQQRQGNLMDCPQYQKVHKQFRRVHVHCTIGNMLALVCTFVHLHYLASKIVLA